MVVRIMRPGGGIPALMPLARIRVDDHGASCHLETTISTNHREEMRSNLDFIQSVVSLSFSLFCGNLA